MRGGERITRTAPPPGILNESAVIKQVEDVTVSSVLRALGKRGIFRGRELAFEAVQQAVNHQPLAVIKPHIFYAFPKAALPGTALKMT